MFSKSHLCQPDIAFTLHLAEDTSAVSICQLVDGKLKAEKGLLLLSLGHEQMTALLFSCNQYRQRTAILSRSAIALMDLGLKPVHP